MRAQSDLHESTQAQGESASKQQDLRAAALLYALADKYAEGGRYGDALPIAEQALAAYLRTLPGDAPPVVQSMLLLAQCELEQKKEQSAQKHLQAALAVVEAKPTIGAKPADRRSLSERSYDAGRALRDPERARTGERLLKLSLALSERRKGARSDASKWDKVYGLGVNYLAQERYDEALTQLAQALAGRKEIAPQDQSKIADCYFAMGAARQDQGRLEEAEKDLRLAVELRRQVLEKNDPKTMAATFKLGQNLWRRGLYAAACPILEDALERLQASEKPNQALVSEAMYDLGWAYLKQKDFKKAMPLLTKSLDIRRQIWGDSSKVYLGTLHDLAVAVAASGDLRRAETLLQEMKKLVGKMPPEGSDGGHRLLCDYELAVIAAQQDHLSEAQSILNEAINAYGAGDSQYLMKVRRLSAEVSNTQGLKAQNAGDLPRAVEAFEDALEQFLQVTPRDYSSLAAVLTNLGDTCVLDNNDADALQCYDKAIEISARAFAADSPILAGLLQAKAAVLVRQARYDAAHQLLVQAAAIRQKDAANDPESLAICNQELANVLRCLGQYDASIKLYSEGLAWFEKEKDLPNQALCLQGKALSYDLKGDDKDAITEFERAVKAYDQFLAAAPTPWQAEAKVLREKVVVHLRQKAAANASQANYLASVKGFRWKPEAFPLRVYVATAPESGGFSTDIKQDFVTAINEWVTASGGVIKFAVVDNQKDADVVVENLYHSGQPLATVYGATNYESIKCGPGGGAAMLVRSGIFCPYDSLTGLSEHERAVLHAGFLHEIGHILGFVGHSASGRDVMYWVNGGQPLSPRDKATMFQLYH